MAFDHACSGLSVVGFGFEGFALGWIALATDLRLPLILAAIPDGCHFDHSRHVQVWKIFGKNDFQDQDRFLSVALSPVIQGKEDGAPGGIRTHDHCLRRAVLYPAELLVQCGRHNTHVGGGRPVAGVLKLDSRAVSHLGGAG